MAYIHHNQFLNVEVKGKRFDIVVEGIFDTITSEVNITDVYLNDSRGDEKGGFKIPDRIMKFLNLRYNDFEDFRDSIY